MSDQRLIEADRRWTVVWDLYPCAGRYSARRLLERVGTHIVNARVLEQEMLQSEAEQLALQLNLAMDRGRRQIQDQLRVLIGVRHL